eukprot:2340080-Prymnesium_polylepis.2
MELGGVDLEGRLIEGSNQLARGQRNRFWLHNVVANRERKVDAQLGVGHHLEKELRAVQREDRVEAVRLGLLRDERVDDGTRKRRVGRVFRQHVRAARGHRVGVPCVINERHDDCPIEHALPHVALRRCVHRRAAEHSTACCRCDDDLLRDRQQLRRAH